MTSPLWTPEFEPPVQVMTPAGWVRVLVKGLAVGALVLGGLVVLLALRVIERPIWGQRRPVTPAITCFVCRNALRLIGITFRTEGRPLTGAGAVVANHSSWLDIFVLNASKRIYFVSKAEVASWPLIGWLARATGTVFIRRDPREAAAQIEVFRERLSCGHRLLFFPEGTSTDGRNVIPFKPTLFAAFLSPELKDKLYIQPVSVIYRAAEGADQRQYGWWGDMEFGPHLLATLAAPKQGSVTLVYHSPLRVADYTDRKQLARHAEEAVRSSLRQAGVLDN